MAEIGSVSTVSLLLSSFRHRLRGARGATGGGRQRTPTHAREVFLLGLRVRNFVENPPE